LCVNNALPWSDFLQLPGRSRDSSPPHAVTNSPTSERGTRAETCSGPSEDPGPTTTGKGGGVTTRPSSAPGSTFSPVSTRLSSAMSAPNTFPRRTPHTSSSQSARNPCRSPRPHRAFFWMTTSPASKRSVLTVRQQPDRITIPQIWSSRSPAFDRPRQSTLKYPAGVSNRPTVHHARRDPPPIHQPLHRLPTCWGGSIPITNLSRGSQIAIAPAAPPYVPLSAVPSLGGFRTPAAELAAPSIMRPASETTIATDLRCAAKRRDMSIRVVFGRRSVVRPSIADMQTNAVLVGGGRCHQSRLRCSSSERRRRVRMRDGRLCIESASGVSGRSAETDDQHRAEALSFRGAAMATRPEPSGMLMRLQVQRAPTTSCLA